MVDLYNCRSKYATAKVQIPNWKLHPENEKALREYLEEYTDSLSPGRQYADFWILKRLFYGRDPRGKRSKRILPLITKSLSDLALDDFKQIRARLNKEVTNRESHKKVVLHFRNLYEHHFSKDESKRLLRDTLFLTGKRAFFKWESKNPVNTDIDETKYYTEKEFFKLLRVAQRPIERALLAVAWESTARPNEYLSCNVGDVIPLSNGFKIKSHISKLKNGKTKNRFLYLFSLRTEFNEFWSSHPYKDDPKAPLFYRDDNEANRGKSLSPAGANKIVKKLDSRSKVNKNGTLYFFRHGGFTAKISAGMNEAIAGKDMGWSPGSGEARRYLHLREEEVMEERLRLAGEHNAKKMKTLKVRICPFCNQENSPAAERCKECGQELDMGRIVGDMQVKDKELATLKAQIADLPRMVTEIMKNATKEEIKTALEEKRRKE